MKRILPILATFITSVATAATLTPVQLLNPAGSTSGQAIVSTGSSTAPVWGTVTAGSLTPVAGDTVIANTTSSTASPTAAALPSCSASGAALKYTLGIGFSCATGYGLTGSPLSQFSATTSAQLAGVISDETGSGALVFGTSPTISGATLSGGTINSTPIGATTASTGAFTTLSASSTVSGTGFSAYLASPPAIGGTAPSTGKFTTLQATGAITPSSTAGIVGTATNDDAVTGSIGEFASNTSGSVALTSGSATNITSLVLGPGDWEVWGNVLFQPAGSTSVNSLSVGVSSASATLPAIPLYAQINNQGTGGNVGVQAPRQRFKLAGTTTIYLVTTPGFTISTMNATGVIFARRPR
ncbi:hypothetical protein R1479_04615 [Ralstonia mannitolilytica]|uniref:hypothetical protein n=1 Tax=Ralstonia mannitolilytica TaxID=105219 RepID=UPI0028F567D7|nr:hypothetical protein [Ralstonia mannitolilytica]CAJ0901316.1 hypothetical protein R1479_04615 [Ralstonia mannitolilytica]